MAESRLNRRSQSIGGVESGTRLNLRSLNKTTRSTTTDTAKFDSENIDDLISLAESKGLEVKDPRKKKPGVFARTLDFISRPLYASAGAAKAIVKGNENPWAEAWKGLTGEEKDTYSDVLLEAGVENKFVRGGVGFVLDVVLDPTTYFGGSVVKGVGKGAQAIGRGALKGTEVVAPRFARNLTASGKAVKDALGTAFVNGFGVPPTAIDDITVAANKAGLEVSQLAEKSDAILKGLQKQGVTKEHVLQADDFLRNNRLKEFELRKNPNIGRTEIEDLVNKGEVFEVPNDPKVKAAYDELLKRSEEVTDSFVTRRGFPIDQTYKFYSADMLSDAAKGVISRGKPTASSVIEVGPENYLKQYKGLIQKKDLLENPFERLARTEANIINDAFARSVTDDFVANYGKHFGSTQEALQAGYVPIFKKAVGEVVSDISDDVPKVLDAAGNVVKIDGATPIGFLKKDHAEFLSKQLYPELSVIDGLAKATGFDGATNLFKTMVTAYFPAFHVRNFLSGIVQNYQVIGAQALNPVNWRNTGRILKKTDDVVLNIKGHKLTGKELFEPFNERFKGSSRYMADLGGNIDILKNGMFKPGKQLAKRINGKARAMGDFVETTQKAVAYSAEVRRGLAKGLTPKEAIKKGLKVAEDAGFDYSKVTPFEAKVMRRVIPFYTFGRKNAELQLKTLYKNPERILNQVKFANMMSNFFGGKTPSEEDLQGLPPWARDGLGFNVGDNRFLTQFGLPLEEFLGRINEPFKTTTSSLNPVIKYPIEARLGYDFFRGKDIRDIQNVSPEFAKVIEAMPEPIKNQFQLTSYKGNDGKTKYRANPDILHFLRNLPTARLQGTLEKQFSGDQENLDKFLAFISGIKIYDINLEQQRFFDERDAKRELQDELYKAGVGGEFKKFFKFKEGEE